MKVSIVDYGIGNLLSVKRALEFCGADVSFVSSETSIKEAERLVVPGVGAFKRCMSAIEERNLKESLLQFAESERPYLGICVGMQMLLGKSFEFGEHEGLNLIPGSVEKMSIKGQRIPFIGWKEVELSGKKEHFYFVHSYHAIPLDRDHVLSTYKLGDQQVVASIQRDNIMGVQFHPEKSAESGLNFLKKFLKK